ncbi:hypothetical protein BDA99DRAFT_521885 [Phascolomyces articulosus]|uniref:Uncharacterized protein n=1 Tax=Phascolomyces articulosus TaxID=60185 RepID=A0AAD5K228_9FUNG|nr:hypothetical protein BDA99DRAFT_521885 [Phascolomyces articulosus]
MYLPLTVKLFFYFAPGFCSLSKVEGVLYTMLQFSRPCPPCIFLQPFITVFMNNKYKHFFVVLFSITQAVYISLIVEFFFFITDAFLIRIFKHGCFVCC